MRKDQTPGADGLTREVYQHFCPILGPFLLKIYHESFHTQTLPDSCNVSYVTPIPKVRTDKTQLKNVNQCQYWYIDNTDYKILTKTLEIGSNRIWPHSYMQNDNAVYTTEAFIDTHTFH